jgi:hypothetical protein
MRTKAAPPAFAPEIVRELALCFARAAVDEMLAEQKQQPKEDKRKVKDARKQTMEERA